MKKLLNILYVTTPGCYLHRDGETVAVEKDDATLMRLPIHTLQGIVCLGRASVSPGLMRLCAERQVLSFLSERGEFLARVQGEVSGNVLLRRTQYRWADDTDRISDLATSFVAAKIANCRTVLLRAQRESPSPHPVILESAAKLAQILERLLARPMAVEACEPPRAKPRAFTLVSLII